MATLTKEITTYNSNNNANGKLRLTFEYTQSTIGNYSSVKLTTVEFQSSTQTGTLYADGVISVGGVQQVEYTNSGYAQDKCVLSALNTYAQLGYTLDNAEVIVYHDTSGNGSIPIYLGPRASTGYSNWNIFNTSVTSGSAYVATGTVYAALPQISDTLAVATPVSPVNTVEDGSASIRFEWTLSNDSGIAPQKSQLQTSADGSTWTTVATVTSGGTSYTKSGFSAGTVYWRVRAYNRDNVAGSWSSPVSFIVVAAPAAPTVRCNGAPFATITWSVNGQQAYKISVDGKPLGVFFGTEKTYTLEDYLEDGEHTASVEVQGGYGMWSAAGTVEFTVENNGGQILIGATFDIDAHVKTLSWATSFGAYMLLYRDGKRIARKNGYSVTFVDRLSLGEHSYYVIQRLTSGHYYKSNEITGTTCTRHTAIAALSGGDWVYLPTTDESDPQQGFSYSKAYDLKHYSGAEYPVLEMSSFSDRSGSYKCAFKCPQQAAPLMSLLGKTVIVKSKGGNVVVGPFAAYDKTQYDLYVAISFSIPAMHYEDYVT